MHYKHARMEASIGQHTATRGTGSAVWQCSVQKRPPSLLQLHTALTWEMETINAMRFKAVIGSLLNWLITQWMFRTWRVCSGGRHCFQGMALPVGCEQNTCLRAAMHLCCAGRVVLAVRANRGLGGSWGALTA